MTLLEAKRCTLVDFEILQKAYAIKMTDETARDTRIAWFHQAVKATKGKKDPKPKYRKLSEFYNAEEAFWKLFETEKETPKVMTLADKNRILQKLRKEGNR